jgi:hypothetical protein
MPDFVRQQPQNPNHLVSPAKPDRGTHQPARVENPILPQKGIPGNQTAQRFAQSCPLRLPSPSACPFGGVCHACPVQAKLKINEPGDKYEQEANRVAEQVMSMPEPRVQRQEEEPEEEEEPIQAKPLAEQITPLAQRQVEPEEEEEEPVQAKPLLGQITPLAQRQVEPEEDEEEEEPIQTKLGESAQVQRQEEKPEKEEEEPIQTKRTGGQTPQVSPNLATQIRSLKGSGQPLRAEVWV